MTTVVGSKNIATHVMNIGINIAIDIWTLVTFGPDILFFIFLAFTFFQIFLAYTDLKKSISVDATGVKMNGTEYTYDRIVLAQAKRSFFAGNRVTVTVDGGKQYRFNLGNFQEVADAINNNKAISSAPATQPAE
ncbi:MAG: hypothetical protein FWB93_06410 [Oscillospiraceae bacterium]|nr:hypothetical protein [Oscillospiraceae bacterium]